jgi:cytochrome c-type protein NapB
MKTTFTMIWLALAVALGLSAPATAQGPTVKSLRGDVPLNQETKAAEMAPWSRDRDPIPRDYLQQPPLIPHKIDGYVITARDNKCMDCHSWARYKQVNATKISLTHFKDRGGTELSDVSPLRYFCTQCHVPQTDAKPLVQNNFKPVEAVRQKR